MGVQSNGHPCLQHTQNPGTAEHGEVSEVGKTRKDMEAKCLPAVLHPQHLLQSSISRCSPVPFTVPCVAIRF